MVSSILISGVAPSYRRMDSRLLLAGKFISEFGFPRSIAASFVRRIPLPGFLSLWHGEGIFRVFWDREELLREDMGVFFRNCQMFQTLDLWNCRCCFLCRNRRVQIEEDFWKRDEKLLTKRNSLFHFEFRFVDCFAFFFLFNDLKYRVSNK